MSPKEYPVYRKNTVFKFTTEDWHPSYKLDGRYRGKQGLLLLEVSLLKLPSTKEWRVCVWGSDDFGMERDYARCDKKQAIEMFLAVIAEEVVSEVFLKANKFQWA
jgi:hypothetical protein